jgi:hypothetical protein
MITRDIQNCMYWFDLLCFWFTIKKFQFKMFMWRSNLEKEKFLWKMRHEVVVNFFKDTLYMLKIYSQELTKCIQVDQNFELLWIWKMNIQEIVSTIEFDCLNLRYKFIQIMSSLKNIVYEQQAELISRNFQMKNSDHSIRIIQEQKECWRNYIFV